MLLIVTPGRSCDMRSLRPPSSLELVPQSLRYARPGLSRNNRSECDRNRPGHNASVLVSSTSFFGSHLLSGCAVTVGHYEDTPEDTE